MNETIDIMKPFKDVLDKMEKDFPFLSTASGAKSHRTIEAKIEGVDLQIRLEYDFTGDYTVEKNWVASDPSETDLWELESNDVRRQVEHACDVSLARNGRL